GDDGERQLSVDRRHEAPGDDDRTQSVRRAALVSDRWRAGESRPVVAMRSGLRSVARLRRQTEVGEALPRELLRFVPPLRKALFLLAQALAELVLEFDELLHELSVEPFLLFREQALGALTLSDLPLLDPRKLHVTLLFERGNHRIDAETQTASLVRHPTLDAVRGLLDGALELFARRRAKGILRFDGRGRRLGLGHRGNLDRPGQLHRAAIVVGRVEGAVAQGVLEGGAHRDLRSGSKTQTKWGRLGLGHPAHVTRLRGTAKRLHPGGRSFI